MKRRRSALVLGAWLPALLACGEPPTTSEGAGGRGRTARSAQQPADAKATEAPAPQQLAGSFACPPETRPVYREIPEIETQMEWCERSGASGRVQHGPWQKRRRGRPVETGAYQEGLRHGSWTLHWSSGQPQSAGEYREGVKTGVWVFWDERGEMMREVDYGVPEAEAPEIAEAEETAAGEPGEEEPVVVSLRVENSRDEEILLALEPSGDEYAVAPGSSFEVSAVGPDAGQLIVESWEDGISLWAGEESQVEVREEEFLEGQLAEEVLPEPAL